MQVAQAFREIGLEGRAPQAALNCLQDVNDTHYLRLRYTYEELKLLEHAPASLSQRIKNRLVHTAIHLTKAYDIQPERLVLKNHLQLCGGAAVNGGGFADVWKGILNGEEVCVKVIRTNRKSADAASKEFSKEALIWRQLNHPNVLPFYGVYYMDDARSMLCLVSPWMEHGHVMEYLRKSPPSINRVALAYDVASGLAYLHGENVVHGDLKGANILVSASGKACIGDFGLSSVTDIASIYQQTDDASSSYFCGSANWAAPEVLQSGQLSDKSDIYAFACVVYELFAGHAPFADVPNGGCAILFKVVIAKERAARPLSPVLSDAVWALVTRCWAHEPAERPSAQEAMAALRAELEATPEAKTWDASIPSKIRAALEELPFCPTVDNIKILTGKLSRVDTMDVDPAKPSTGTIRQGTSRADGRRPTKAPYGAARPRATTLRATAPEYIPHSLARSHSEPWQTEVWHAPKSFVRPLVRTPSAPSASPYSPTPSPLASWSAYAQPPLELQNSKRKTRDSAVWNQWRGDDVDSWEEEDTLVSSRAPSPASTCVDSPQQRTCLLSLNPRAAEFVPCAVSKRECWNF
ncbi:kinase-like protein [Schizophyllum commune H4-8]|uniref:kinase-like protein n=1 Tax=Schizophyllum commune (strain H4-8 / FGSC 9210) TaxID=578458 RepID=UPI00215E2D5C|nr:kinase-like protein [Schizophyllum commune H4-8]KAI5899651.1 kinase-like protein [Schizophyllum commune H4-8]